MVLVIRNRTLFSLGLTTNRLCTAVLLLLQQSCSEQAELHTLDHALQAFCSSSKYRWCNAAALLMRVYMCCSPSACAALPQGAVHPDFSCTIFGARTSQKHSSKQPRESVFAACKERRQPECSSTSRGKLRRSSMHSVVVAPQTFREPCCVRGQRAQIAALVWGGCLPHGAVAVAYCSFDMKRAVCAPCSVSNMRATSKSHTACGTQHVRHTAGVCS